VYEFTFQLSDEDFLEFNQFHFSSDFSKNSRKAGINIVWIVVPAIMLVTLLLSIIRGQVDSSNFWAFLIVLAIPSIIAVAIMSLVDITGGGKADRAILTPLLKWQLKAIKKDGKAPFGRNNTMRFEDEYIYEISELSETRYRYSAIEKIGEGNRAIYLYLTAVSALIVPYSVFESREHKDEFLTFVNERRKEAI